YTEQDIRTFSAFLAGRVAGTRLWAIAVLMLMPLFWNGNIRHTWPLMVPVGLILLGFVFLLRFKVLPAKLYKAAVKLPGVFDPRTITIDGNEVRNASDAGSHTFRLQDIQEVVATPDYLFVMVKPKQGIPIPRMWLGDDRRATQVAHRLQPRRGGGTK
ncbi:MAG TPA: YcxB family protein, partial [Holophaga sp.]|nr:YcxB family protein [Holophaga sp.]